jgi:hypothetical protein
MGQTVSFDRPDGQAVPGYLAQPAVPAGAPGVVVIQEWWGLNDQIRGVADRFAAAGYLALVPDLYRGKSTVAAAEAEHLMTHLNFGDAAGQDVRGAVQYLKARCARVGVTGFCMGGALTLLAAVHVPEADAGVVWYGFPPLEYIDAVPDRHRRQARGQAERGGCGVRVPPLPGDARLRQRDPGRREPAADHRIPARGRGAGLDAHAGLLQPPPALNRAPSGRSRPAANALQVVPAQSEDEAAVAAIARGVLLPGEVDRQLLAPDPVARADLGKT